MDSIPVGDSECASLFHAHKQFIFIIYLPSPKFTTAHLLHNLIPYHLLKENYFVVMLLWFVHQSKFSVYERAIYAALSGNLSQVTKIFFEVVLF